MYRKSARGGWRTSSYHIWLFLSCTENRWGVGDGPVVIISDCFSRVQKIGEGWVTDLLLSYLIVLSCTENRRGLGDTPVVIISDCFSRVQKIGEGWVTDLLLLYLIVLSCTENRRGLGDRPVWAEEPEAVWLQRKLPPNTHQGQTGNDNILWPIEVKQLRHAGFNTLNKKNWNYV